MNRGLLFLITLISAPLLADTTVPKSGYLAAAQERLPTTFCSEGTYFRSCFAITESECKIAISDATVTCSKKYDAEIPQRLTHPQETAGWGAKLGACVGAAFETTLKGKLVSTEKCEAAPVK